MDADIFDRGGPRVVEALDVLVKIVHPEIFGEADTDNTSATSPGFTIIPLLGALAVLLIRRT